MKTTNLDKELRIIGKYMVSQIRRDMTSNNIKASGKLYRSIKEEVREKELIITSLDYGSAILGEGTKPTTKKPSEDMVSRIIKWMSYKNMSAMARVGNSAKSNGRGGRFRKRTANSERISAYAISSRILRRGIKGSNIIQNAVRKLENRIDKGIVEAYKADIEREFSDVLIRINKANG